MTGFRRAEPDTPVEALARRSAVPSAATDPLYQARNARVLEGLRRAASLHAPQPGGMGSRRRSPPPPARPGESG